MRYHHCITCATLLLGCFNLTGAFAQTVTQTGAIMPGPVGVVAEGGDATFSVALSTAAARETFTMLPSVFTSAITQPQRLTTSLICVYQPTGATVPNCVITLSWSVRARSGGHLHNTDRPPGIFTTRNGVTGGSTDPGPPGTLTDSSGSAGVLEFTYTSPQASGITDYTASGLAVVDGKTVLFGPASFTIGVQVGGLQLASGDGLQVNAASDMHGNNNGYATPVTIAALQRMAQIFAANLTKLGKPVPPVRVNALSLPQGGHFDFKVEWQTPHRSHRFGKEADIRIWLTNEQREKLAWALYKAGFSTPVPNERPQDPASSHWHLRMP